MSFAVCVRTARDPERPSGYRVRALWNAMEYFHPFGFHATRNQLARLTGVPDGYWSQDQLLRVLDVLEQTRGSWSVFVQRELHRARTAARERPGRRGPGDGELFVDWFVAWLTHPGHAELWGVAELGDCDGCGHLRALHLRQACLGCCDAPATDLAQLCRQPSPLDHASHPLLVPSPLEGRWARLTPLTRLDQRGN